MVFLWDYFDGLGDRLHPGEFVTLTGWSGELFQIKQFQYPADAIIENVVPGGRLGTSTIPCSKLYRAINNPVGPPSGYEDMGEADWQQPVPGSVQPCGCHVRRVDVKAVLCREHLIQVNVGDRS